MTTPAVYQSNKDIDPSLLLGYMFFYNLGELKIEEDELVNIFVNNGLQKSYVKKISKVDAFRRASSDAKQTIEINYYGDIKKAKIEVDEVRCDKEGIVRLVGRKVVDEKNEKLSYQAIGRLLFDRDNEMIMTSSDPAYSHEYNYGQIMQDTEALYHDFSNYHTKDTVRNITVNVLKKMYPVNLLPTGLAKFIPKSNKSDLYALQGVIKDLSAYGQGNLFEIIPVIDTLEQRDMVNTAAVREIKSDLHAFTEELREVLVNKQSISVRTATSYAERFKDLKIKVSEYEQLLGTYMGALTQQIQAAINLVESSTDGDE